MMQLATAAEVTNAVLSGNDQMFTGVSIDTRTLDRGELFVAISGEHLDGHHYLSAANQGGAAGAMVRRAAHIPDMGPEFGLLKVRDTTEALGQLGAHWRRQFDIPVIGITGSNGKTTVTAMVRQILGTSNQPLAPKMSYNNQWGVPLTLLELHGGHTHAVIEMGMNHRGEIDYLTRIAHPTVALINNAAAAHLEGLGSVREVALAKAEIINGLSEDGSVVVNADDDFADLWTELAMHHNVLGFGLSDNADVYAANIQYAADSSVFDLVIARHRQPLTLPVAGQHNIYNALAAAAACHAAGVDPDQIRAGLVGFEAVEGRQRRLRTEAGARLIDDSFNANPSSTSAAIDVLARQDGRKVLVLGAMAELGEDAEALHAGVGERAKQAGIHRLLVLTDSSNPAVEGYFSGYGSKGEGFDNLGDLLEALARDNHEGVTILVKGSKSSRMGRVVQRLLANDQASQYNNKPSGAPLC